MAYVSSDPNNTSSTTDDNEDNTTSSTNTATPAPTQLPSSPSPTPTNVSGSQASSTNSGSTGSTSITPGGTGSSSSSATPTGTSSGRFQNLQGYLTANANYNNGQGLAGQVGNTLTNNEQTQAQANDTAGQATVSAANQASAQYDPTTTQNYLNTVFQDPTKADATQFQQYYNGTYTAPTAFDSTGDLNTANTNFQTTAAGAGTENGRMAMLQQLYGNPGYSSGQQSLDNLLLQSQPGQLGQLQTTASNLSNQLGTNYTNNQTNAANAITAGQTAATNASTTTQDAYNNYVAQQQAALQQTAAQTQAQRQSQYDALVQQAQNGQLSSDAAQQLGLTNGQNLYGVNAANYLTNNVGNVGVGNVATAADQAKFQALANLSGQPAGSALYNYADPTQTLGNVYTANQAGLQNQMTVNKGVIESALGGQAIGGQSLTTAQLNALTPAQLQQYTTQILNYDNSNPAITGGLNLTSPQQQALLAQLKSIYGNGFQSVQST